ncbi:MAG: peptidylprolyl isomerase [Patescibacteria group bacterium]
MEEQVDNKSVANEINSTVDSPPQQSGDKKPVDSRRIVKMLLLGLASAAVIGVVVIAAVLTIGIYWLGWEGPMARTALETFPYPIAKVNDQNIRYSDYLDDLTTLKNFFANQVAEGADPTSIPDEAVMRENAMERLIFTAVLEQEAAARNVTVSAEDIDKEYEALVAESGGQEAMEAELQTLYGWQPYMFKEKVLHPYLLQLKLSEALKSDEVLNADALAKVEEVKQRLAAGENFEEVARQTSDDPSVSTNSGDLGWFARGIMVEDFEEAVFALQIGETSEPVLTPFGYHLIRLDDTKEENGEIIEVTAHHILIATTTVEDYIDAQVKKADVTKYVN